MRRDLQFKEGDMVMVHLKAERLPKGRYTKLIMRKMRPFKILQKYGTNVYKLELPTDIGLSDIFNVCDLYPYNGNANCDTGQVDEVRALEGLPKEPPHEFECLLDTEFLKETRRKTYYKYLVKWKNKLVEDASWLTKTNSIKIRLKVQDFPTQET